MKDRKDMEVRLQALRFLYRTEKDSRKKKEYEAKILGILEDLVFSGGMIRNEGKPERIEVR